MTSIERIEQLQREIGWSAEEFDSLIKSWSRQHGFGFEEYDNVEDILGAVDKEGEALELLSHLIEIAPFHVQLSNGEHGVAMAYCGSKVLAEHDQSIDSNIWECPGDMDEAYAALTDRPTLLQELRNDGYIVNADDYCPPDPDYSFDLADEEELEALRRAAKTYNCAKHLLPNMIIMDPDSDRWPKKVQVPYHVATKVVSIMEVGEMEKMPDLPQRLDDQLHRMLDGVE